MNTKEMATKRKALHQDYYGQFVTVALKQSVLRSIGFDRIIESRDEYFNNIPLAEWDRCNIPSDAMDKMKEAERYISKCNMVCLLKEAARQIKEGK